MLQGSQMLRGSQMLPELSRSAPTKNQIHHHQFFKSQYYFNVIQFNNRVLPNLEKLMKHSSWDKLGHLLKQQCPNQRTQWALFTEQPTLNHRFLRNFVCLY